MPESAKGCDELLSQLTLFGIRLGLDSTRKLLDRLGNPHLATPAVLIAGTNGKGSTAALLASMATASGYRTGLYTSPHLEEVEERIRLDGLSIEEKPLRALLERILDASHQAGFPPPTYFEALTVAAWLFFAESKADLAILEVGLGGRLDATNACHPILSLITEISLDHQQHLGTTLSAIAREKAGIFRTGRPALAWTEATEAQAQLVASAKETQTPLELTHSTTTVIEKGLQQLLLADEGQAQGQHLLVTTPLNAYDLELSLKGHHQRHNLALAVRAAEVLETQGWGSFDSQTIERGVAACRWPGRLEAVSLPNGQQVLLDAAHNPDGAQNLADFLGNIDGELTLVFGVVDDKDVPGILGPLLPLAQRVILTMATSDRALPPRAILELAPLAEANTSLEPNLEAALEIALSAPTSTLVICGSIFLVGPARKSLRRRFGMPPAPTSIRLGAEP
ncbi:MAG: bifunctional folylpolyglutamate synthase/dihydrofolate synthase [Deltaproteobacteria bacterium]|nr:bifunctional folylpolyglutamate synthase/dihydrofolate synthase [Deltaproteobacteria bacterium]